MQRQKRIANRAQSSNKTSKSIDKSFLLLTLFLLVLGLTAVADASSPQALTTFKDAHYFVKQQGMWAAIGLFLMAITANIPYTFWKKFAWPIFFVSCTLLVLVLIPGIGSKIYGARRWLYIGSFGFQPSEVVKLVLAIIMAKMVEQKYPPLYLFGTLVLIAGLIMMQPDLGTTIVVVSIGMTQIFVSGVPILYMMSAIFGGGIMGLLLIFTSDYRRERLLTFLGASENQGGSSYHIRQVLIALGSGGLWGVGLGQSRQKHLFLPESATDSVFAVIGEELGFVGAFLIMLFLCLFIFKIFKIASRAPDEFSMLLAVGIGIWIAAQMFFNIASMVALTPLTGIPLPFFSYGGTSLTMLLISIGILLNISRYAKTQ